MTILVLLKKITDQDHSLFWTVLVKRWLNRMVLNFKSWNQYILRTIIILAILAVHEVTPGSSWTKNTNLNRTLTFVMHLGDKITIKIGCWRQIKLFCLQNIIKVRIQSPTSQTVVGDNFMDHESSLILATESLCWRLLSIFWCFFQWIGSVTNISNLSSQFCPQHPSTLIRQMFHHGTPKIIEDRGTQLRTFK